MKNAFRICFVLLVAISTLLTLPANMNSSIPSSTVSSCVETNSDIRIYAEDYISAYLTFRITVPGQNGILELILISAGGGKYSGGRWTAACGDNTPENHHVGEKGPIPPGTWEVHSKGEKANHPFWYYLTPRADVDYHGRDVSLNVGFFIHPCGTTKGCIAVGGREGGQQQLQVWLGFNSTIESSPLIVNLLNSGDMSLVVSYPAIAKPRSGATHAWK